MKRLGLGRFEGRDGGQLSQALEGALGPVSIDGRPYFTLVLDSWGDRRGNDVDGVLSGSTSGGVEENDVKQTTERCVEEKDGKCVRREQVPIICRRRVVSSTGNVRISRPDDGSIAYSTSKPRQAEVTWCPPKRENPPRTVEDMVTDMIGSIAQEVRAEITPSDQRYSVRFLEDRTGMDKEVGNRFKLLVKQSQRDPRGACAGWAAMQAEASGNPSIPFNLALCTEAQGDYRRALAQYEAAQRDNPRKALDYADDIDRTRRLILAAEDDVARARRR